MRRRRDLLGWVAGRAALVLALVALAALIAADPARGIAVAAMTALGWAIATGFGLVIGSAVARRRGSLAQLLASRMVAAALGPVVALIVVLIHSDLAGGLAWRLALGAAAGWGSAIVAAGAVRAMSERALLVTDNDRGEAARAATVHGAHLDERADLAGAALSTLLLVCWALALAWVPALVVVLVPLAAITVVARGPLRERAGQADGTVRAAS